MTPLTLELFHFFKRKYIQRADERQKDMGLSYTTAETQDLAKTVASYMSTRAPADFYGVWSESGVHIGTWADKDIALKVFRDEYPLGEFIPLSIVPASLVTEAIVEKVTMSILGKKQDLAPGVNWQCNRSWRVNDVRDLVRQALIDAFKKPIE